MFIKGFALQRYVAFELFGAVHRSARQVAEDSCICLLSLNGFNSSRLMTIQYTGVAPGARHTVDMVGPIRARIRMWRPFSEERIFRDVSLAGPATPYTGAQATLWALYLNHFSLSAAGRTY
jgi:hypothetical protein